LCELANPAKWDNPEWRRVLDALRLPADKKLAMHRKAYEFTQAAWGLDRLGALKETVRAVSVGAGHESLAYWLANRVRLVVATDLYPGDWQASAGSEGDARVIKHPEEFAPFPHGAIICGSCRWTGASSHLRMPRSRWRIRSRPSSISADLPAPGKRWRKWRACWRRAACWRSRRNGVFGPSGAREGIFEPDEVRALVDVPSLELVEPIDDRVWHRYAGTPVNLRRNRYETPHMLLEIDGTVFTSVMMFLRKKPASLQA
jgi:hypothetical protein